jgi:hypothetical protein
MNSCPRTPVGWFFFWCIVKPFLDLNVLLQLLHSNFSCPFKCSFSFQFVQKNLSHFSHENFFGSFWCIRECFFKYRFVLNLLSQTGQTKFSSVPWVSMWRFKCPLILNLRPHSSHLNFLDLEWMKRRWFFTWCFNLNVDLQSLQENFLVSLYLTGSKGGSVVSFVDGPSLLLGRY